LVILEGIRRSGKSHTIDIIKKNNLNLLFYKDHGVMYAMNNNIDVDDYVISRDLTYAQLFTETKPDFLNKIIFDRQYLSSYVYGQYYRNKYDKSFWRDHIKKVEELYYKADLLDHIKIVFIKLNDNELTNIAKMNRAKDQLEDNNLDGYKRQYDLYQEALLITKADVHYIEGFKDREYIIKRFTEIFES